MLLPLSELVGYTIRGVDGDAGDAHDLYFDRRDWGVSYVVVDTGGWLVRRRVLISPHALGAPDPDAGVIPASLTRDQVRHSPEVDFARPVTLQQLSELHHYYGWPAYVYWSTETPAAPGRTVVYTTGAARSTVKTDESLAAAEGGEILPPAPEVSLHSARQVATYRATTRDGPVGRVRDLLLDAIEWRFAYLVLEPPRELGGGKVLVESSWVETIDWARELVVLRLGRTRIPDAPRLDEATTLDEPYLRRVSDHLRGP